MREEPLDLVRFLLRLCLPFFPLRFFIMYKSLLFMSVQFYVAAVEAQATAYTAPAGFPSAAFSSYYVPPTPSQEPQPAIFDPVLKTTFPFSLTDPMNISTTKNDPVFYPPAHHRLHANESEALVKQSIAQVQAIIAGNQTSCQKCHSALAVGQNLAQKAPNYVPGALVSLCQSTGFASNSSCLSSYSEQTGGAIWAQVLSLASVGGQDGDYICHFLNKKYCPAPTGNKLDTTNLFPKPKPADTKVPAPSGERVKVLHLSDVHLDPRYYASSEANCTDGFCCRTNVKNANPALGISQPASLYGAFKCDSPYDLVAAAFQAIGPLTGTNSSYPLGWTLYTGDIVAHDAGFQMSEALVEYTEVSVYDMLKTFITGPVFAALGNHDASPVAIDGPHSLPNQLSHQFSWNYDHVSDLWLNDGWITPHAAQDARLHYGAYSIKTHYGLRVITLNTDFWYRSNFLNFINTTNPDVSGSLAFLIEELQAAEDAQERVWIIGHILTGWDGTNPMFNPTDLFYQIVDRYSPHVIANIMFGHTHEDQNYVFYSNNGTVQDSAHAMVPAWMGPSVTPLTNLNSGFRMYEVDTGDFNVYESYTYYADVSSFSALDQASHGPVFQLEYSAREAYPVGWPAEAPLNATYWHMITEAMETNRTLVQLLNTHQSKSSVKSPMCDTDDCAKARICYMRSGSSALGQLCLQGYGSTQNPFKPGSTI
jgi:hypothetical protein